MKRRLARLQHSPFHSLPYDVLRLLLLEHYLSPGQRLYTRDQMQHLHGLTLVSRAFCNLVTRVLVPAIQWLGSAILHEMSGTALCRFTGLCGLALCAHHTPDALSALPRLAYLRVRCDEFHHLASLAQLRELHVENSDALGVLTLQALSGSRTLERLVLRNCAVSFPPCHWFPCLRSLSLSNYTRVDLHGFTALTELTASECDMDGLEEMTQLRRLSMDACTPSNLHRFLPNLQCLESLLVYDNEQEITAFVMRGLNPSLRELTLDAESSPCELGLRLRLTNLTRLSLCWCYDVTGPCRDPSFTDDAQAMTALRELRLFACDVVGDALLSGLTRLTALELSDAQSAPRQRVTDASLSCLTNLRRLVLCNNYTVTDAALHTLTGLTHLDLTKNRRITDAAVSRLTNMRELVLRDNGRIIDDALVPLRQLRALACPLSCISKNYRRQLRQRGVLVFDDTRWDGDDQSPMDYKWPPALHDL
jgi:hypothetical protein